MGWMPSYPTFNRNPLDLVRRGGRGRPAGRRSTSSDQLKSGELDFAGEDPDAPGELPADPVDLAGQPARLLGQGQRVLPQAPARHRLLAARDRGPRGPAPGGRGVARARRPRGSSTCCSRSTSGRPARRSSPTSCCRRRPGTRSTTSTPPTCTRSCTRSTPRSRRRGRPAPTGTPGRRSRRSSASSRRPTSASARDVVAVPLTHDTPDAMANPHGVVRDWKKGECEPVPGVTMPKLVEVERDYAAVSEKMNALGPLMDTLGATTKGITFELGKQVDYLPAQERRRARRRGRRPAVAAARRPRVRGDPRDVRHHQRRTWPRRASGPSRSAPGPGSPTWPRSTRASRSPSPTPRARRCR